MLLPNMLQIQMCTSLKTKDKKDKVFALLQYLIYLKISFSITKVTISSLLLFMLFRIILLLLTLNMLKRERFFIWRESGSKYF